MPSSGIRSAAASRLCQQRLLLSLQHFVSLVLELVVNHITSFQSFAFSESWTICAVSVLVRNIVSSQCLSSCWNRRAVDRVGVIPIPSKTAPREVPLKMLSYCSILRRELYGCFEMRRKVPPVTSSHAPKRNSYLYLEKACSRVWSVISAAKAVRWS
jgi:hypothetical protein